MQPHKGCIPLEYELMHCTHRLVMFLALPIKPDRSLLGIKPRLRAERFFSVSVFPYGEVQELGTQVMYGVYRAPICS